MITGEGQNRNSSRIALLIISASTLCFEINLTRLFSVSQFYHFAFMVVSIALFGMSASGTYLALRKRDLSQSKNLHLSSYAAGSAVCMLGSYLLVNHLPFDSFRIAVDPSQILILILHYIVLASPFFFSGTIISLMLSQAEKASGSVYALNLTGSALGCLIALMAPRLLGGEGIVVLSALLAGLASLFFSFPQYPEVSLKVKNSWAAFLFPLIVSGVSLVTISMFLFTGSVPDLFKLNLSPYKSVSYALQAPQARVVSSVWNSFSRIDVIKSPSLHSVPGLSYRYLGPLPDINGLFVDGDNLNAILPADADLAFTSYLPASFAYTLRPGGDILLLEPKGGMDILAASYLGARHITATEGNPLIVKAAQDAYQITGVKSIHASGRSFLQGSQNQYDIIQLSLTDSFHPVSSGAYALGEDYRYTVEAFRDMIAHLKPEGLLVASRWLQEDPGEWLRTFTLAVTALEEENLEPKTQIAAIRGYNAGTLFVKKSPFTDAELEELREFSSEKAFDLVYLPGISLEEVNRYNILPQPIYYEIFTSYLHTASKQAFYQSYQYDVSPPTDDHPFFGHYFKWSQMDEIIANFGLTWQPFGGAGYLIILLIFLLAFLLAGGLILLPVLVIKRRGTQLQAKHVPVYFAFIGLAYMLVEMPLIQRFILYLDQPAYAFATVLFCILLFSGLGSRYGNKRIPRSSALILLAILLILQLICLPWLLHASLGLKLHLRVLVTLLLIAPIGFLMGIPFPAGLDWMAYYARGENEPSHSWMVAYVWAVNGACSVLASILASLISLSYGFTITSGFGLACYIIAAYISVKNPESQSI